jgi:hypothetical protein
MANKNNNLDFLSRCSFCGSLLEEGNLTVLEEQEHKTVFHISCSHCETALISILSGNQGGIVSLGVATDLDKNEVKNKFSKETISADEVIDAHEFIESGQGNLMELIKNAK